MAQSRNSQKLSRHPTSRIFVYMIRRAAEDASLFTVLELIGRRESYQDGRDRVRGDVGMEEVESQGNEQNILKDIAERLEDVAVEALSWDGVIDLLDGVGWNNVLLAVKINQMAELLLLRGFLLGFLLRHVSNSSQGYGEKLEGD